MVRTGSLAAIIALTAALSACGDESAPAAATYRGDDPLPNGMTVKQQIEARQHNLKDLGGAFKAVNDQLKTGSPQLAEIRLATQEILSHSQEIGNWFPASTGPESGVKTEARPVIWSDEATFKAAVTRFATEAAALNQIAAGEDAASIQTQAQATGGACKNCHDTFREKKD